MQNKILMVIVAAIVAVAVGAGAFLVGMRMGGARATVSAAANSGANRSGWQGGQGGPPGAGGRGMMGRDGKGPQGFLRQGPDGTAFVGGKVISKDKDSITVSTSQGGSKTVYLSSSTRVDTVRRGSIADISVGETVTAVGNTSSDGSITGRSVTVIKK